MTKTYDPRCDADIHRRVPATSPGWNDPMRPDEESDVRLDVSMRGLMRLALVASEVGARFQREGVDHDAMAWMLAPRRLFGGGTAISACLRLEPAIRAILLHGLGMSLDAEPEDLDELMSDDEEDVESEADAMGPTADVVPLRPAPPRLFTAVMVTDHLLTLLSCGMAEATASSASAALQ